MQSVRERFPGVLLLVVTMLLCIFPIVSMLSAALQPQGSVPSGISWPSDPQWQNFADAWKVADITPLLGSSLILVAGVVPLTALFATMAGFALGQLKIPGGNIFFVLLLFGLTLPQEATIVPLYYQMRDYGLLNSRLGLILALVGGFMPFAVFWMRAHFMSIPKELTEATAIDGATTWKSFRYVQIPLAIPAISSMCLLLFLWTWNNFLQAITLIDDPSHRTMAGACSTSPASTPPTWCSSMRVAIIMAPTIIMFLIFQRQFSKAMLAGAVKG